MVFVKRMRLLFSVNWKGLRIQPNSFLKPDQLMKNLALHWKIIIGLIIGVLWAVLSGYMGFSNFTANWIAPWGRIFINLLKLIAVPLVLFSIVGGIVGLGDPKHLGKLGVQTLLLYIGTTIIAVSLGLCVVNIVKPGVWISEELRTENT